MRRAPPRHSKGCPAFAEREWSSILAPLLVGEAQRAYFALFADDTEVYEILKSEILARCGLSNPLGCTGISPLGVRNTDFPSHAVRSLIKGCHPLATTETTFRERSH